jgi:hypothetical protein
MKVQSCRICPDFDRIYPDPGRGGSLQGLRKGIKGKNRRFIPL